MAASTQKHTSHIEIDRKALKNNMEFLGGRLGQGVRLSAVVKGNAYGHGIEVMVPLLEQEGVQHFAVFNGDEALRVHRSSQKRSGLMVMGMLTQDQLAWAVENGVEFFVFDAGRLKAATGLAQKMGKKARVHLELETGMNRTGFSKKDLQEVLEVFDEFSDHLEIVGICSHLAGAESIANYYRITNQIEKFKKGLAWLKRQGLEANRHHLACSAALMRYPKTVLDLARIGIMLYGFFPSQEIMIHYLSKEKAYESPLRRILSWKSRIMGVKHIARGEYVGYGTSYFASDDMHIATIPVGYSQGFSRALSNQGRVIIRGQYAPVVGIVNMSMISVDVTKIEGAETGDEVLLIGRQGDKEISVSSFSDMSSQVNYELLTRLPSDITRVVV